MRVRRPYSVIRLRSKGCKPVTDTVRSRRRRRRRRTLQSAGWLPQCRFLVQGTCSAMIRQPVASGKYYSSTATSLRAELQECLAEPAANLAGGPCLHCAPEQRRHLRGLIVSSSLACR